MALMALTEQDIRQIVRDEIARLFGINKSPDIHWLDAKEAARQLGYGTDVRPLYHLKDTGVLRIGKEIQDRRPKGSVKGIYYFNIKACDERLNTPPEKRTN
jgi:hypothetical protein